jgi:4-amino-4-deoxy-L-arabinose transferase-like glycosyltransferase
VTQKKNQSGGKPAGTTARKPAVARSPSRFKTIATSLPLILAVALLLRIVFAFDYVRQNPRQGLATIPFLQEAGNIAASLATGHGFSSPFRMNTGPTAWMTPVYPGILAAVFRVFGVRTYDSFLAAVGLNILFSALVCWSLFCAGKRIAGLAVGAAAAWLWAIYPNAILNTFESMWDASLSALLVAILLWWTLRLEESARWPDWCGYGLLWGFALMTNATLGVLLPLLLGWLAYRAMKSNRAWIERTAVTIAITALCCVPWTVRNFRVFHEFVPLRSVFGLQLWLGNNEYSQEIWLGELHPIFDAAERAQYIQMGELAYMEEKRREAFDYMRANPAHAAGLMASRFVAIWSGGTPHPVADFLHTPSLWFRFVVVFNLLAGAGALAGLAVLMRRRSRFWFPLAVFPIVFPCPYYVTLAYPRYRLPIDPVVLLLAAIAASAAIQRDSKPGRATTSYGYSASVV